jgi:DNA polymerase-3 subunit gamma/tau
LARSLNCEQGPTPTPCEVCQSCTDLAPAGPGSIDVIEIDAASHGGVDDARDLRDRSAYGPASSRFKIYIIDEAHMVTTAGFNALLKLVEEPPPHLKFIFATTEPEKVIGTIRSRTHHYPFRLVPPGALRDNLARICEAEGITIEPAALGLVVRAGGGSVRDAQSVLDQLIAGAGRGGVTYKEAVALLGYTDASLLDDVVDAFAAHDGGAVLEIVDRVVEAGHDPRRFTEDLLERLRDLIVLEAVPDAGDKGLLDVPVDVLERMARQAGQLGKVELSRAADIVNAGLTEMRGATSPRLLLELICARVLLPGASDDAASLLVRLERIERRLSVAAPSDAPARERPVAAAPAASAARVAPAPERPATPALERPPAPAPAPAPVAAGEVDATSLRRMWDSVLEAAKRRRRATHALLMSGPAQVVDVRGGNVLVLGFTTGPLERQFKLGNSNEDVLRDALKEIVGVDFRIETTLAGGGSSSGQVSPPAPPAGGPGGDRPAPALADASPPQTPVQPAVADEPDPDDDDADDGTSGIALLQRHLGATVIDDSDA